MRMFLTEYSIIYKSFSNKIVLYDIYLEIKYPHQIKQMDSGPYFLSIKPNFQDNAHLTKAVRISAPYEKILLLYKTEKDLNILLRF